MKKETLLSKKIKAYGVKRLAKELKVTTQTIYNWTRKDSHPTLKHAMKLKSKLKITLGQVYA